MQQAAFLDDEGEVLAEIGMKRAADKADSDDPNWGDTAMAKVREYMDRFTSETFTAEEAQLWAYEKGLRRPSSNNAWGMVFRRLSKAGHIEKAGIASAKRKQAHGRTVIVWRKT